MHLTRSASLRSAAIVTLVVLAGCGGTTVAPSDSGDALDRVPISESIHLPGLPSSTDVFFDEYGMPHVYAADMEAAIFTQGYLTAADRFWEMDVIRRFAEGRLSEILGRVTLDTDVQMRTFFTTRDGRRLHLALWEHTQQIDPEMARLAEAYAAGVNAWLADLRAGRNGTHLPPEYTLPIILGLTADDLEEWKPEDSIAVGRLQAFSLSDTSGEEIELARIMRSLPEALVRDVFRSAPATSATILPQSGATARRAARTPLLPPHLPDVSTLEAAAATLDYLHSQSPYGSRADGAGSNNWIVSPALSAEGHAMLANDPHLALFNPPVWHMIELTTSSQGRSLSGVIFPGLPGVILGHNDRGAWGATTAGYDVTDVYVEDVETPPDYPSSPRTVRFNGTRVPVLRTVETFEIKDFPAVQHVIEVVPHHGPMAPDPNIRDGVVGLAATGMTIRWTGHEITNDSRFLFDLSQASNVADFKDSLRNFGTGAQNWIWADVDGNIAYSSQVLIPQRPPGTVPYLPLPGTGEAEWLTDAQGNTAWLPNADIPQAVNPPAGFLSSANNDAVGNSLDNDPLNDEVYLGYSWDLGFRAQRIHDLLSNAAGVRPAGAKITAADMSHYQYDHSSLEAVRLLPHLFAAAANLPELVDADMAAAIERLREWAQAKPGSPACDALSGIDAHDLRDDIAPRQQPVSAEERADAVATSIFTGWLTRLMRSVFTDDFEGSRVGTPGSADATKALLHILEDIDRTDVGFRVNTKGTNGESTLWDRRDTAAVETRDEIILAALRDGLAFVQGRFPGAPMDDWLWGLIHQVRFQHFIGQAGLTIFDLGPFAAPGLRSTVNPANFSTNSNTFDFSSGPSMRFVAVLDPKGIRAVNSLPGGIHGDPGGTADDNLFNRINPAIHYGDLASRWVNGETFQMHFTRDEVAAHAARRVRFVP